MEQVWKVLYDAIGAINNVIWSEVTLFCILGVGILFTIWSRFCQYRALTHGFQVIRGKYDDKSDPGAISHFQALSAALSATVGLGNIAGVAIAISLGGPGAVFWMWIIGFIGMALKLTEVSLAMLYRNTDDPENPHGGAMWVADKGFANKGEGWAKFGKALAVLFCITLLISSITGGNMFQSWNVAEVTYENFSIPRIACGITLGVLTALVIIGGIKRIGSVAGKLVPFMCVIYLIAGMYVLILNIDEVPGVFSLIFNSAFGKAEAHQAFLGGTFGYAFIWGMKRSLFSNEAGQGSAPIAHSAAKTDEPIREGVVAGLEPFIDTILVCTLTSLIILSTGAWNRGAEGTYALDNAPAILKAEKKQESDPDTWVLGEQAKNDAGDTIYKTASLPTRIKHQWNDENWNDVKQVFVVVRADQDSQTGNNLHMILGDIKTNDQGEPTHIEWSPTDPDKITTQPELVKEDNGQVAVYQNFNGAALTSHAFDRVAPGLGKWLVTLAAWLFALSTAISWSYYGEQGVVYLFGDRSVLPYRLFYCGCLILATVGFLKTDAELDTFTALGTGCMLVVNLPICLIFGRQTMAAYHEYGRRLKAGEMDVKADE